MLLVSAVMLGSSTFAWFSMNNKVTATGLDVVAKSNTEYLIISNTADAVETDPQVSIAAVRQTVTGRTFAADDVKSVYPVAYNDGTTALTLYDANKADTVSVPSKGWYTAYSTVYNNAGESKAPTAEGAAQTTIKDITVVTDNLGNYVIEYKVWISVAKSSNEIKDKKVNVTATFSKDGTGNADNAVCALVSFDSEDYYFAKGTGTSGRTAPVTLNGKSNHTFNHDNPVPVTIRLFVDGTSANVNSSFDITALTGKLVLDFAIAGATA